MNIHELFYIKLMNKRMQADIYCTEAYKEYVGEITEEHIRELLTTNQVAYGIHEEAISLILDKVAYSQFPLTIASGLPPIHGKDGFITYTFDTSEKKRKSTLNKEVDFRDVMHIPNVEANDEIAVETLPTKGENGKNISGIPIKPIPGKRKIVHAGKNVRYDAANQTYYSTAEGQVSTRSNIIEVHDVFVVHHTLSMDIGNIDFVGSVEIHGDVPTGYTIKADGDIRVFGLVEAATLVAGGAVYIKEGFAGLQKGRIESSGDVHVSYVNQGNIESGESIYVKNSIMHSTCHAKQSVLCKHGDIIGGSTTARLRIHARDIGSRVHTQTIVGIDEEEHMYKKEVKLLEELDEIRTTIKQLSLIGEKLQTHSNLNDPKMRVTLLRQKSSMQQAKDEEDAIHHQLEMVRENYFHDGDASITAQHALYGNVTIVFGKYERSTLNEYQQVVCRFTDNEITISSM